MNARVVVAGVLGGLVVFVWSFTSHMLLPLGEVGFATLPNQEAVLDVLADQVKEQRLYMLPYYEDQAKYNEVYAAKPHGILAVTPPGGPFSFPKALAVEALTNVVGGILAAFVFAASAAAWAGFGRRICFGATLGAFASLAIDFSQWNWYDFPAIYVAAQLADHLVGWSLAALVIGWWLGRR